jgi:hypothetical protein
MPVKSTIYCVLCLSGIFFAEPVCSAAQTPPPADLTGHVAGAARAVRSFSRSHSTADLRAAVVEMQAAGNLYGFRPTTFIAQRRTLVRGWAQLLKVIEDSYDSTYDPDDQKNWPIRNLPEPRTVRDPKLKAIAEADWAANQQKIARQTRYFELNHVDMLALSALKMQLDQLRRAAPDGADADFAALDGILHEAGLSAARRAQIDAMFYARPGG